MVEAVVRTLPSPAPWPTATPPVRADHEAFGRFIDERTAAFVEACRDRRLPALLSTAVERCADHYWLRRQHLRRLRYGHSLRRKRTERRCAHVSALQFLLAHLDLASLQCLVATPAGLKPMSVANVAEHTGLSMRRVEHVLADLARAGYLRTKPQHEKLTRADGSIEIVNHVAIRWLTPRLFEDLGLGVKLAIERQRAHTRHMARRAATAKQDDRQHPLHDGLGDTLTRSQAANVRPHIRRPASKVPDIEQLDLMRRAAAVKAQHPTWDRQACYAEAHRQLTIRPPG
nr:hypothetical protein [uncultured Ralstonia sp.]